MYKIARSTAYPADDALFSSYRRAGIEAAELSLGLEWSEKLDPAEVKEAAEKNGIALWSFHLPFMPFAQIDPSLPALAPRTLALFERLIARWSAIGIRLFVIHPSGEPIAEEDRPARMACAKKTLAALADIAARFGATVAIEDLPRTCLGRDSADMLALLSAHPDLRVCFDTNHLLHEDPVDFVRAVGDRIVTTHVSDYDFVNERHWLPGEGKVNWQALLAALKEIGYTGPWLYEIGYDCPKTILRDRDLVPEDFVRNARALFAGEKPAVLSTPKPNLGFWE